MRIGKDGYDIEDSTVEERRMAKRIKYLDAWWEERSFPERRDMVGQDDESYSILKDQGYDETWDNFSLEEKEELYDNWHKIY